MRFPNSALVIVRQVTSRALTKMADPARAARIQELRNKGLTSTQIGERLGMRPGAVREALNRARKAMALDEKPKAVQG